MSKKTIEPVKAMPKDDQPLPMVRVVPGYKGDLKINMVQIYFPAVGDEQERIVDQEQISANNMMFTSRAKRALKTMIKRQQLISAFISSIK